MTFVPDTKDWTWVLQRPCPECGFDTQSFAVQAVPEMIMANAAAWQQTLTGPGDLRRRPAPGKWSAVEYGCHVRDVFRLYDQRSRPSPGNSSTTRCTICMTSLVSAARPGR